MNTTQYSSGRTADTSRGLTPSIWGDCPFSELRSGIKDGLIVDDDFSVGNAITAVTADATLVGLPYYGFNSAASTHTQPDVAGGELALTSVTDNLASFIRSFIYPFQISSALGDLWFEARVKVSSITNPGMIVGLWSNVANTVDIPLSAANPPIMATTGDFVGFRMPEGAGAVDTIYKASGVAVVAGQTVNSAVATLVANTYVKLGMRFNRRTGLLSWYVNGVPSANTKVIPNATSTDFPATVRLGLLFGQKLSATASIVSTIDRWTCVQLYV